MVWVNAEGDFGYFAVQDRLAVVVVFSILEQLEDEACLAVIQVLSESSLFKTESPVSRVYLKTTQKGREKKEYEQNERKLTLLPTSQ